MTKKRRQLRCTMSFSTARRFCLLVLLLAPVVAMAGQVGKTTTTNVTSIAYDADSSGGSLLFRSDDYNGSGQATYTAVNNIESFLTSTGIWYLNLYPQKTGTRMAYITPDDPVGAEPTAP